VHEHDHAVDQPLQIVVELGDLVGLQPQRAVAVLADLRERELAPRLGLTIELVVVDILAGLGPASPDSGGPSRAVADRRAPPTALAFRTRLRPVDLSGGVGARATR